MRGLALALAVLCPFVVTANGVKTVISENNPGVSITYKETSVCETTDNVSAFAGFVRIPSSRFSFFSTNESAAFNLSTFYWFFPARHHPESAPLSIYLAGGPGFASTYAAAMESGPCVAQPDNNSTEINPWSFNNYVNMLYIDQPNYAGFSYDVIQDGLLNIITNDIDPHGGPGNATMWPGKFGSQDPTRTASTSQNAAKILYEVVQAWIQHFPACHRWEDKKLSIWGNSYGGYFTTTSFAFFQRQNERLAAGQLDKEIYRHLNLDTVGITNGCMDLAIQARYWPEIAYNNTYNVSFLPKDIYEQTKLNFTKPGGCLDQITQCRDLASKLDPDYLGTNEQVNGLCASALDYCSMYVEGTYMAVSGRSSFDMAHLLANPWPPNYPTAFFNQQWVQNDLGVPLNLTLDSNTVTNAFFSTGDFVRQDVSAMEYILNKGIKVALLYGDRDYVCNWLGVEALSLAVNYTSADRFRSAGYTPITTNASYTGGVVRQAGRNLSFSRIFQSGHSTSSYQPETVYRIFMRAMFDKDVATGQVDVSDDCGDGDGYTSKGPLSSWGWTDVLPGIPPQQCSLWEVPVTCDTAQAAALLAGNATIDQFIVVDPQ